MTIEEEEENGVAIVSLAGEADLDAVPEFQRIMRGKMKDNAAQLVIDFSEVTFVNTPVWAVVVEYYQHTLKNQSSFAIAGLRDRVEASFNIVRLGEFIRHFPTVDGARAALQEAAS